MTLTSARLGDESVTACACGLPLHYLDPIVRAFVEHVIDERGPNVVATIGGRAFEVPRHYIALHGLDDVDTEALGFADVPPALTDIARQG
jgi:hypothetical protein